MRGVAEEQDDEHHADVHGEVDYRDIELSLYMGRMLDSHAWPEVQVHGFAQYGEGAADKCLTGNDCRTRGHDDGKNQHILGHDGKERIHGGGSLDMVQHPCSLPQIVEDEHGLYEKPADGDVLSAAVTQVGVKSLSTGGTEEHGTENQEPLWRFCQQHGSIVGVEGLQNQWVRGDAESSRYAQQQEPYQHEYSERLANALCTKALHKEDDGDDAQCDGDDWQVGTDAFESFDGCGNRDGRGDDSICQQGAGTDDGQ